MQNIGVIVGRWGEAKKSGATALLAATLLVTWLAMLLFAIAIPLHENDALQYVIVAKMIFEKGTAAFYPVVIPDPTTGFYATSSHPLGFMGIYLWIFQAQASALDLSLIKWVTPIYVLYTLLAVWAVLWKRPLGYSLFAGLLLLATPIYFIQSTQLGIDAYRMAMLLIALTMVTISAAKGGRWLVAAALFAGMSMFSHSVNLLFTLPLSFAAFLLNRDVLLRRRIIDFAWMSLAALLLGGYQLVANQLKFGVPIYDSLPVYSLPIIHHSEYVWYGNQLFSGADKVLHGLLRGWSQPEQFWVAYWLFSVTGIGWMLGRRRLMALSDLEWTMLFAIGLFYLAAALSLFLGMHVFVANNRYLLTVQPMVVMLSSIWLGALLDRKKAK
jgi:hypothetical protein